jgi:glycosyltransferase involved in cell wall biosynthesis
MTSAKKTVLFTLDGYEIGGVSTFVQQYVRILVASNVQVIILGRQSTLMSPSDFFPGCNVIVIPEQSPVKTIGQIFGVLRYFSYLHVLYKNFHVDVVHMSTVCSSLYALLHPYTWKSKRVITYYGSLDLELQSKRVKTTILQRFMDGIRYWLQHLCLRWSDVIVVFSQYARNQVLLRFSEDFERKIKIIPGFIQDDHIKLLKQKEQNSKEKIFRILNYGRAETRKGIGVLFDTLLLLKKSNIPVLLYLASPVDYFIDYGWLKLYEEKQLFQSLYILHKINSKQIQSLLEKVDVFVMPSVSLETFGLTIIESLSYGIPVVGTPIGAIPEIIGKVNKGLISTSNSSVDLARALEKFWNLSDIQKFNLRLRSIEIVKNYYSESRWKNIVKALYNC